MNSVYTNLIARFPTSEALFAYLRSEEGGRLIVRDDHLTADLPLTMIYYDKERSDMKNPNTHAFRSVVWNALTNRPVATGPLRGLALTSETVLPAGDGAFIVEEFVDGVMVNHWWNGEMWEMSTRTQMDAGGSYYGERSFQELFSETFYTARLNADDHLDKTVTYSWVLQHPEERVVVAPSFGTAKLTLVERSRIDAAGNRHIVTDPLPAGSPLQTHLPARYEGLRTVADIQARVASMGRRLGAGWQGVVVKVAATGERYKLRSVQYNAARFLRGNQPKRPFLWLERWTEGKLPAYLRQYPEEEHEAQATIAAFKAITQEYHALYLQVYKDHTLKLKDAPIKYRKLLWEGRQANIGTYFPNHRNFLNGQHAARKLWLVNFEKRYPTPAAAAAVDVEEAAPAEAEVATE
jgi:hypothetical protein